MRSSSVASHRRPLKAPLTPRRRMVRFTLTSPSRFRPRKAPALPLRLAHSFAINYSLRFFARTDAPGRKSIATKSGNARRRGYPGGSEGPSLVQRFPQGQCELVFARQQIVPTRREVRRADAGASFHLGLGAAAGDARELLGELGVFPDSFIVLDRVSLSGFVEGLRLLVRTRSRGAEV